MFVPDLWYDRSSPGKTPIPIFKFVRPGTALEGRILGVRPEGRKDFLTGENMYWSDGTRRLQVVYIIAEQGTGKAVAVCAPLPSNLLEALRVAFITGGVVNPVGQVVRVEYTGDDFEVGSQFPTKQFSAEVFYPSVRDRDGQ